MTEAQRLKNLTVPTEAVDVVLDTDTFNEIDDQFALAYLLRVSHRLRTKAIYAAPFKNNKAATPEEGMERSYDEILHILRLSEREDLLPVVYKGSTRYLPDEKTPVPSPAAEDLVERSRAYSAEHPLYVIAIGAITNVASALLIDPTLAERIVLVWLGGHAFHIPQTAEFNMRQDIAAARIVFACGVPLVQLPCVGVVDAFRASGPELEFWLMGQNPLCDYLARNTIAEAESYAKGRTWSRVIWDVTAVAWLLNDKDRFMTSTLRPSPIPTYDNRYAFDARRHFIRYVEQIRRDELLYDLFMTLRGEAK